MGTGLQPAELASPISQSYPTSALWKICAQLSPSPPNLCYHTMPTHHPYLLNHMHHAGLGRFHHPHTYHAFTWFPCTTPCPVCPPSTHFPTTFGPDLQDDHP